MEVNEKMIKVGPWALFSMIVDWKWEKTRIVREVVEGFVYSLGFLVIEYDNSQFFLY